MKGLVLKVSISIFEQIIVDDVTNLIVDDFLLFWKGDHILIREINLNELLTGRACIVEIESIEVEGECIEIDQKLINFKRNPMYHLGY